ncbi:MAG TPA: hypothetical protein VK335_26195 [Bryobacteraceae bacterium]|nr:hypothetical protein [Bryobacteraceae bacterium]
MQLERMLANPLFKNSKRYPNLLRYIVEQTLEGQKEELRERTLGVEVFGREPNYDTNADPVVRATAGEIRKRIAQYYHEHGHEGEIRIDLSPGSYVPVFETHAPVLTPATIPRAPLVPLSAPRNSHYLPYVIGAAAVLVIATALVWIRPWVPRSALDRFWAPVLDSDSTVLLCVGQRQFLGSSPETAQQSGADLPRATDRELGSPATITLFKLYYLGSQNVAFPDVTTLARLTGLLAAKGKNYRVRGESSTSFADLRDGPVVLVGALNNDWTMRLMGAMRFSFERENDIFWIKDQRNPSTRNRGVNYSTPYLQLTEDYAIITRVLEPMTERMVVVAGGLTGYGTTAAGEFLTDPDYLQAVAKQLPKNWEHKNIQLVIDTKVINGNSGPPRVVDQYTW